MLISNGCGDAPCVPCDDCPGCTSIYFSFDSPDGPTTWTSPSDILRPPELTYVDFTFGPGVLDSHHEEHYTESGRLKINAFEYRDDGSSPRAGYAAKNANLCNGFLAVRARIIASKETPWDGLDGQSDWQVGTCNGICVGDPTWPGNLGYRDTARLSDSTGDMPSDRIVLFAERYAVADEAPPHDVTWHLDIRGIMKDAAGTFYSFTVTDLWTETVPFPGASGIDFWDETTLEIRLTQSAIDDTWTVQFLVDDGVAHEETGISFSFNTIATLAGACHGIGGGWWDDLCITTCDDYTCPTDNDGDIITPCCPGVSIPGTGAGLTVIPDEYEPPAGVTLGSFDNATGPDGSWVTTAHMSNTGDGGNVDCEFDIALRCIEGEGEEESEWELTIDGIVYTVGTGLEVLCPEVGTDGYVRVIGATVCDVLQVDVIVTLAAPDS